MSTTTDRITPHWQLLCSATARHAVALLHLVGKDASGRAVLAVVASAPRSPAEAADPEWRQSSYCGRCLDAVDALGGDIDPCSEEWATFLEAREHFTRVLPALGAAACEMLSQSVAGLFLGLRCLDAEVAPRDAWPMYLKSNLWREADAH